MAIKRSRAYLEEHWLPILGQHPPVLDVGTRRYTAHYRARAGTERYVTVDIDPDQQPDLVADVTSPDFVGMARALYPEYGSILFNGLIGYGIDTPAALEAGLANLGALLARGGLLLVGWNEWDIDRHLLFSVLSRVGLANRRIDGHEVFEPEETPGYEHLEHHYTCWIGR